MHRHVARPTQTRTKPTERERDTDGGRKLQSQRDIDSGTEGRVTRTETERDLLDRQVCKLIIIFPSSPLTSLSGANRTGLCQVVDRCGDCRRGHVKYNKVHKHIHTLGCTHALMHS